MKFILFDREENYLRNLENIILAKHVEEINGEDILELEIADNTDIKKGYRILYKSKYGYWNEFIVKEVIEERIDTLITRLFCESSFYETLGDYIEDRRPAHSTAAGALMVALEPTRWEVGTIDDLGINSTNFYNISSKEAVQKVAETWKGELRTRVIISGNKITHRYVDLLKQRGNDLGKRFTYTKDLEDVTKTIHRDDVITALYGYGKGEEVGDGYGRRINFSEINNGKAYVENNEARLIWGRNNPDGSKSHIFGKVEFDDCEDREELKILTEEKLEEISKMLITYEANVIDLKAYGFEHEGTELGDTTSIIDKEFRPALRLKARVVRIERDLLENENIIILGNFIPSILDNLNEYEDYINNFRGKQGVWDRSQIISNDGSINAQFLNNLVNELNTRMNSLGGYVYISEDGQGLTTYDKPVDQDPTMAIQLLGGSFRIANSKLPNGEFDWRTFGDGNGFVADSFVGGLLKGGKVHFDLTNGTLLIGDSVEDYKFYFDGNRLKINLANGKSIDEAIEEIELTPGPPGESGPPGPPGEDGYTPIKGTDYFDGIDGQSGESQYLWIRYSQNSNGNPFTTDPTNAKYIGIATTLTNNPPSNYLSYTWSLVKGQDGIKGEKGEDGQSSYLHIKYSNDGGVTFTGNGGEDVGSWIGTYIDFEEEDSSNPNDYTWNKVKGDKGEDGIKGEKGEDGAPQYTWIAYADNASGGGATVNPLDKAYIGIAYNRPTSTPSLTNLSLYKWSKIKGDDGIPGSDADSYTWVVYADDSEGAGISLSSTNKRYIGISYNKSTSNPILNATLYSWSLMTAFIEEELSTKADGDDVQEIEDTVISIGDILGSVVNANTIYENLVIGDESALGQAMKDIQTLMGREVISEAHFGPYAALKTFIDTYIREANEGIIIGTNEGTTKVRITHDRIDFIDGNISENATEEEINQQTVAYITNQLMKINRGIFVQSATIGEHKIETIADGHTIVSWMGG